MTTVQTFETGKTTPVPQNLAALERALEEAGIEFFNGDGPRVRLRRKEDQ